QWRLRARIPRASLSSCRLWHADMSLLRFADTGAAALAVFGPAPANPLLTHLMATEFPAARLGQIAAKLLVRDMLSILRRSTQGLKGGFSLPAGKMPIMSASVSSIAG